MGYKDVVFTGWYKKFQRVSGHKKIGTFNTTLNKRGWGVPWGDAQNQICTNEKKKGRMLGGLINPSKGQKLKNATGRASCYNDRATYEKTKKGKPNQGKRSRKKKTITGEEKAHAHRQLKKKYIRCQRKFW